MGMLLGLGILWALTEIIHRSKPAHISGRLKVHSIIRKVDTPTVLFFLGILSAVACLQSVGHLNLLSGWLNEKLGNIFTINIAIGIYLRLLTMFPLLQELWACITLPYQVQPATKLCLFRMELSGNYWPIARNRW